MVSLWGYSELQDAGRGVAEPLWDGQHGRYTTYLACLSGPARQVYYHSMSRRTYSETTGNDGPQYSGFHSHDSPLRGASSLCPQPLFVVDLTAGLLRKSK